LTVRGIILLFATKPMITQAELDSLLLLMEQDRIKKTISITDNKKFGEAICAFANDLSNHKQPGYLIIGAKDNGSKAGMQFDEKLIQTLLDFRTDGRIVPPPALAVKKFTYPEGDEIVVVEVQPHILPPVRFNGKVCVRVGPRKGEANEAEERILSEKRSAFAHTFDALPCMDSSLEDLSIELFKLRYLPGAIAPDTLEENHRDLRQQLASLKFYDLKMDCPTNAGVLLFGLNPRYFIPGAYVQYVRFAGEDEASDFEFEHRFEGDLTTQLGQMEQQNSEAPPSFDQDPKCLALLKHYHSLAPMSMEARKPIFALKPADGAIGAHFQAALKVRQDFKSLVNKVQELVEAV
jgi:ATP-dependent DNA helicase RecG